MGKRARERGRQQRLLGSKPGANWTAGDAAERVVRLRDDQVLHTGSNPLLIATEALSIARGVELKQQASLRSRAERVSAMDIFSVLFNRPLAALPPFPADLQTGYLDALRHLPEAAEYGEWTRPDGIAARIAAANAAKFVGDLRSAELFVVSPALHEAVCAAARTVSQTDLFTWRTSDLAADSGLLLLPYTQQIEVNTTQSIGAITALTWRRSAVHIPGEERWHRSVEVSELGPHSADTARVQGRVARTLGHPLPRLQNHSSTHQFLDLTQDELESVPDDYDADTRRYRKALAEASGFDDGHEDHGEHEPGAVAPDPHGDFPQRYLFCFMRLAEQRIATTSKPPAAHENGRRVAVAAEKVRVVRLRSLQPARPEGVEPSPARAYKHRFIVSMHKVRQWYPSEQRHKVIWRGPYIKGPDGAPLLPGEKVRALTR